MVAGQKQSNKESRIKDLHRAEWGYSGSGVSQARERKAKYWICLSV